MTAGEAAPSTSLARRKARRSREAWLPWLTTPVLLGLFVAAWAAYVELAKVSPFILPAPGAVWTAWLELLGSARAWGHTGMTVYATLAGFAWALVAGVALGIVVGRLRWLEATLHPFIVATQVVPKVALVPLFVVWFGFGIVSKVIVAAVIAFFPIFTNTVLGVKSIDAGHRDVMVSLNATRLQVFRRLELPSALPYILTGMEVGVVLAIIGAIVGEYLGGNAGLGYLLIAKMNAYETDALFAVIVHMTLLGFALSFAVAALRRLLLPWHAATPGRE